MFLHSLLMEKKYVAITKEQMRRSDENRIFLVGVIQIELFILHRVNEKKIV